MWTIVLRVDRCFARQRRASTLGDVEKPKHVTREIFGSDISEETKRHPLKGLCLRSDARAAKGPLTLP
jgi:hypothetical protein